MAEPFWYLGALLVAALAVQVLVLMASGLRRLSFEHTRASGERERLQLRIQAEKLRIRTVQANLAAWNGFRKFTVARKVEEAEGTYSFYLEPHDGRKLPPFLPGQYLTFQLTVPGYSKALVRCYSLSDCARETHYRVTIKRAGPPSNSSYPPGVVSSWFTQQVKPGDILDVKAPAGHFALDLQRSRPLVLIGGGVGLTPVLSMANALAAAGLMVETWFFIGMRNSKDHILKKECEELAARAPWLRLQVCYSQPLPHDVRGRDYQQEGRVTIELLKATLPSANYDYHLCGPGPFMETLTDGLEAWGVPDEWVHYEAFGPATRKKIAPAVDPLETAKLGLTTSEITFSRSGKKFSWDGSHDSLLDFAEAHGVSIDAGCRAGNCGSCLVAIKAGEVEYAAGHDTEVEKGSCLTCICRPKGSIVLDA